MPTTDATGTTTYESSQVVHPVTLAARLQEMAEARDSGMPLDQQHLFVDLDDCALDSSPRTIELLRTFLASQPFADDDRVSAWLNAADAMLREGRVPYLARELWQQLAGKETNDAEESAWFAWWFERFFTNEALLFDQPRAGVVDWLQEATRQYPRAGYLTGRHRPNPASRFPAGMEMGTLATLWRHSFPLGKLLMKGQWDKEDVAYKRDVFERLVAGGRINPLGYIDNEPGCVLAHHEVMTAAGRPHLSVWFKGVHSTPLVLPPEILVLERFTT